ncbi:NAD-dependent epimerase/dehydratase family protein [Pseudomonas sp. TE3610]
MNSTYVLVTGATGFVGRATVAALRRDEHLNVIECVRGAGGAGTRYFDLSTPSVLPVLDDVDVIVHTAARVHVMNERAVDSLAEFRRANVDATLALARHAAAAGVKRFVYISSIKVNGESTAQGQSFLADDAPAPQDAYGRSKHEAEEGLRKLAQASAMEFVIIRPVLVYGAGVKANFLSMMRWVQQGVPLPLGAIQNRRSMVYLANLVSLIECCVSHPGAANQVFLASDAQPVSTSALLAMVANAMGRQSRLLPVPVRLLQVVATLLGKKSIVQRLAGSLQVDIEKNQTLLGWAPPVRTIDGLKATVDHYMSQPKA